MSRKHAAGRAPRRAVVGVVAVAVLVVLVAGGASAAWAGSSPSPAGGSVTPESGWSDVTWYIAGAVVAFGGAAIVVWLKRRGGASGE